MNENSRRAVVVMLLKSLRDNASWGGETHLQKATYFLQDMFKVPSEYHFVLYKHGPFSFDLRDDIGEMRAEGLIEMEIQDPPYGPKLMVTDFGEQYLVNFPRTTGKYRDKAELVAEQLGGKTVIELEAIATAFYVINQNKEMGEEGNEVENMRELKPHITEDEAEDALGIVDQMLEIANQ
jgi:uncharacterized protein YwgA